MLTTLKTSTAAIATVSPTAVKVKVTVKRPKKRFPNATKNILAMLELATAQELVGGKDWYREAHDFAQEQANKYGLTLEIIAGIISALSPATDWERNKADAIQVLENNRSHKFGTYGPNAIKAFKIRDTAAQERIDTLFPARKTFNFYQNIVNPSAKEFVTIDRHALSIAMGMTRADKSITDVEYRELAAAYNVASKKAGMLPCEIQAVTWCIWRSIKGYKKEFTLNDAKKVRNVVLF